MTSNNMSRRRFKNFIPDMEGKEIPLDVIIRLLYWGLPFKEMPSDVQEAVREEMARRFPNGGVGYTHLKAGNSRDFFSP